MASPLSGNGGEILAAATPFHVSLWRLQKTARLVETTDSSTAGVERWSTVVTGGIVTFEFVWDADNIPDTDVTLDAGDSVSMTLNIGASAKTYAFTALVETLEIVDDNVNDVIRGTGTARVNGAITAPVT